MIIQSLVLLGMAFGILTLICNGVQNVIASLLNKKNNAITVAFWYFLVSSVVLAVIGFAFFKPPVLSWFYAVVFVVLSFFSAGALISFYKGLKVGKVAIVVPVAAAWSIITAIVGIVFLNEALSVLQTFGIILTIFGTILVAFRFKDLSKLKFDKFTGGMKYAIITMVGWGVFFTSIGILSKQLGWIWPIIITSVGSTIVLLLYALSARVKLAFPAKATKTMLVYILLTTGGLVSYGIGTHLSYISLVGPIAAASPFITVILARIWLKEKLERGHIVGIACILAGVIAIAL